MKTVFFRLIICLITLLVLESCSIFGIKKIKISQSEFTYTDDDILSKGKLYSIKTQNNENIVFPIYSNVPAMITYDRPNEKKNPSYIKTEYQPTILFLTKERFVLNMGCTVYGKISKPSNNSFDIISRENSNDCQSEKSNEIQTLVINALKGSTKCTIEKNILSFKKDDEVLMVYKVISNTDSAH